MTEIITPSNITFALGILGVVFGVYHYFRNPQVDQDRRQYILEKEAELEKKAVDEKFESIEGEISTLQEKIDSLLDIINEMNLRLTTQITKLETTISERYGRSG